MLTTFRAFAWLRWRLLVNSFERTGSRDVVERFSIALEKIGPIVAGLLLIPSAIVLGVGGVVAGYVLATDPGGPIIGVTRFVLFVLFAMSIMGPIVLPSADRTNPVRLLLLPIPRRTLYLAQAAGALGDPWILLALPLLAGIPLGLAAGGAITAAVVAAAGGMVLAAVLAGVSTLTATLMHMLSRDKRRGELLALLCVVIIPILALMPSLMSGSRREAGQDRIRLADRMERLPAWVEPVATSALGALPSELYTRLTRQAVTGAPAASSLPLAGLTLAALLLHAGGMALFGRVLDGPASTTTRRAGGMREIWTRPLPWLSPGASAVALGHVRLVLRTPRGRAVLLTPFIMFGLMCAFMWAGGGYLRFGPIRFENGFALAIFATVVSLVSILPIAANQFAVDRAGLTMVLLSPIRERDYLAGKAAGNALVTGVPALVCILVSLTLFPGGTAGLWLALPLGMIAAWLAAAPALAILSALFPRAVDMNSIGRGSNAHGAAGFLGLFAIVLPAVPAVLAALTATAWLGRPALAPVFVGAWLVVALGLNRLTMPLATRLFVKRRENMATLIR